MNENRQVTAEPMMVREYCGCCDVHCPVCGEPYDRREVPKVCHECGQHLITRKAKKQKTTYTATVSFEPVSFDVQAKSEAEALRLANKEAESLENTLHSVEQGMSVSLVEVERRENL